MRDDEANEIGAICQAGLRATLLSTNQLQIEADMAAKTAKVEGKPVAEELAFRLIAYVQREHETANTVYKKILTVLERGTGRGR